MPKLPKNIDRQFKERVEQTHAWGSMRADQARSQRADDLANQYAVSDNSPRKGPMDRFRSCLVAQKKLDDFQRKTEASRQKRAQGVKLGFFERRRVEKADRKMEQMEEQINSMYGDLGEYANRQMREGPVQDQMFYRDLSYAVMNNRLDFAQERDAGGVEVPSKKIFQEIGYESPKMQERRAAKDQAIDSFIETPEMMEAHDFGDSQASHVPPVTSETARRQMNSMEIRLDPSSLGEAPKPPQSEAEKPFDPATLGEAPPPPTEGKKQVDPALLQGAAKTAPKQPTTKPVEKTAQRGTPELGQK